MTELDFELVCAPTNYRCFSAKSPVELPLKHGTVVALIGRNNVGKSTFLRFLYEMRHHLASFSTAAWATQQGHRQTAHPVNIGILGSYGLTDYLQLFPKNDPDEVVEFGFRCGPLSFNAKIVLDAQGMYSLFKEVDRVGGDPSADAYVSDAFGRMLYFGAHRNLVNATAGGSGYYDLSVGSAFVAEWDSLKYGVNVRNSSLASEAERIVAELCGWKSVSISKSSEGTQLFLTADGIRYALSELGGGIAEIVLCIVVAAVRKPSWILIDEPESHLHPALQLKFLSALQGLCTHGVLMTTHSVGLARAAADTIFAVSQDQSGASVLRPFEAARNYSQLMGELAFSQHHELGFEALLLCEGVTEVKTLRQFLRILKLDSKVMLIPLGGTAMIDPARIDELREFKRFGLPVFALIDSEKKSEDHSEKQRTKFVELCLELFGHGHAIQTKRRATENYFPLSAIQKAKRSEKYRALSEFEKGEDLGGLFWGKNDNWRVAAHMTKSDLLATDIGEFLQVIHGKLNPA